MNRLPSTVALAIWLGYALTSAVLPTLPDMVATMIPVLAGEGGGMGSAALAVPHLLLTLAAEGAPLLLAAGLLGVAVCFIHAARPARRRHGEWLGLAGLGLLAIVAASPWRLSFGLAAAEGSPELFWALLVLSAAAILFDRLVSTEDEDDAAAFEAGILAIARGMARQTHAYAERSLRDAEGPNR